MKYFILYLTTKMVLPSTLQDIIEKTYKQDYVEHNQNRTLSYSRYDFLWGAKSKANLGFLLVIW